MKKDTNSSIEEPTPVPSPEALAETLREAGVPDEDVREVVARIGAAGGWQVRATEGEREERAA
jgi:hypothetical protein